MNKNIKLCLAILSLATLVGCVKKPVKEEAKKTFGDFGYNGIFLKEYATKQITVNEAKQLVSSPSNSVKRNSKSEDNVNAVLSQYSSLITIVKYYVSDKEEQQVRKDIYQGTDFKYLLSTNHYEPFGQMSVKYIFVDDELLDEMEKKNEEFKESSQYLVSPFNDPYTYHADKDNNLVIQTHSFAELPASTGGGIGSTFREDCELVFDTEGKISFWQSSLGLYTSTPTGTVREGYIFEVEFQWVEK